MSMRAPCAECSPFWSADADAAYSEALTIYRALSANQPDIYLRKVEQMTAVLAIIREASAPSR